MTEESAEETDLFAALESDLATTGLVAMLKEWITQNAHKVTAFTIVLRHWADSMILAGYSREAVEASLPLMIERLWTLPDDV